MMRVLITGCNGQLGTEIQKQLRQGFSEIGPIPEALKEAEVTAVDLPNLNISKLPGTLDYVAKACPDIVINCAAYTNVDGCEANPDLAFAANAVGPRNLAMACEKIGAKLVHVSTDYVFSGRENGGVALDEGRIPGPISAYGTTKLLGEDYVRQFCRRSFIVRTAWLYSYYGRNFVKTMCSAGRKNGLLTVVNDQLGNPTNAVDLAHVLLQLAATEEYGIYHCTGNGICSWYDFAAAIIQNAGIEAQVLPCTSAQYKEKNPQAADRPAWSALDNQMLRCTIGDPVRPWQEALSAFFENWDGENGMKNESR